MFRKLEIHTVKMRPISACYTSGRGNSLNRALFELRPLHYKLQCSVDEFTFLCYHLVSLFYLLAAKHLEEITKWVDEGSPVDITHTGNKLDRAMAY